jgi:flagellum-specific peptidoglycan hydrolase FlgJ
MTNEDKMLLEEYVDYCNRNDINIKSIGIAQLMIESSHATSELYTKHHNPFGIKYTENADYKATYNTTEFHDGKEIECKADFAGYYDLNGCFDDYKRITDADKIHDFSSYLNHLNEIGYATNPAYIRLILDVINDYNLTEYDGVTINNDSLFDELDEIIEKLARKVINGDFGNGDDRKRALGGYYTIIQNRVNELLK